jgi:hypothetical protein
MNVMNVTNVMEVMRVRKVIEDFGFCGAGTNSCRFGNWVRRNRNELL